MDEMEIKKIKLHKVLACKIDEKIIEVSKKLKEKKERRIFVVDKDKLVGIITTTDLVYKVLAENKKDLTARDVMTKEVKSVDINEDIEKALEIMNSLKTFACPVTVKGKLLGLVSYHDLVGHVICHVEK